MRKGNVFILPVRQSVCLSVQAITFECLDITSFYVWWDILTICRSSLSMKVIGSGSRSLFGLLDIKFFCYDQLMVLILLLRSRSSRGEGSFEVKVIPESNCKCLDFYPEAVSWLSTECILVSCYITDHITGHTAHIVISNPRSVIMRACRMCRISSGIRVFTY